MLHATLIALDAQITEAGTRRDGTAEALASAALDTLNAMASAAADLDDGGRRFKLIDDLRWRARRAVPFCRIHDQAARGDLDGGADYRDALAAARAADARFAATL